MRVTSWLHVCVCDQGHTLAATCASRNPQDRTDASLRCLQRYSVEAIAEDSPSRDLTAAVSCSSVRNRVGAQFTGATSAFLYCMYSTTSVRFSG